VSKRHAAAGGVKRHACMKWRLSSRFLSNGLQLTEGEGKVVSREVVTRQKKGRMARLAVMPTACSSRPEWMKVHQNGQAQQWTSATCVARPPG
jgi:hypothetical protein